MDIIKRAYLKTAIELAGDQDIIEFVEKVRLEVIRLIKVRAYGSRDWPKEFGPIPDELRKKKRKWGSFQEDTFVDCTEENPCCDRRNEYNGFASGPLKFVCPKHCSCHH